MSRQIITIDQSPCRASYGLLRPQDFLSATVASQKQTVRDNIANIVAIGDRLGRYGPRQDVIVAISAEAYLAEPPKEIVLRQIDRPTLDVAEISGGLINLFI